MDSTLHSVLQLALFTAAGVAVATPLLLLNVKLAPKLGLIDRPKARGLTQHGVPIVGHSLVLVALVYFGVLCALGLVSQWFFATTCLIALMGHWDDVSTRPASDKMIVQIACVTSVMLFDPKISYALVHFYGPWGTFWGIFFMLGLMNAINFIDGIDGLAGVVLATGALGFLVLSWGQPEFRHLAIFAAVLLGMIGPFLFTNVIRRKGFLGNTGSYFFSYLLALMHLSLPLEQGNILTRLALPGLCFLVPIADAVTVLIARVGTGRSPFQADKGHLHHRLIQTQFPHRLVLAIFASLEGLGLITVLLFQILGDGLPSAIPLFIGFTYVVLIAGGIVLVEKASRVRVRGYFGQSTKLDNTSYLKFRLQQADGKPLKAQMLKRVEARVTSEIRISDFCYTEGAELVILLRHLTEPLEGAIKRMEFIFAQEKVRATLTLEKGPIGKYPSPRPAPQLTVLTN